MFSEMIDTKVESGPGWEEAAKAKRDSRGAEACCG